LIGNKITGRGRATVTQYQITLSDEIVHGLFKEDGAMAKLVEQVLNQVLEAEVTEMLQVRPQSALIVIGVNMRGYREVLGFWIGDSETYGSWNDFLAWLKGRGLRGVDLVVSDQHGGLVKAVETQFQEVMWQKCQIHFTRNILDAYPKQLQSQLHSQLRVIWEAPDVETARQMLHRVMDILEQGFDDAVAVLNLPERYRKRLRTTNGIERLNEEVRRRERVIRIFPNVESAKRLLGALLMEKDEAWSTGRQYFDMRTYVEWKQEQTAMITNELQQAAVPAC